PADRVISPLPQPELTQHCVDARPGHAIGETPEAGGGPPGPPHRKNPVQGRPPGTPPHATPPPGAPPPPPLPRDARRAPGRRRQRAHGIGDPGIADHEERLAAAAAEILRLARTRAARLGHPGVAPEPSECVGMLPDPVDRAVAHVLEPQRRDAPGRVTGPDLP